MEFQPELLNTFLVAFVGALVIYVTRAQVRLKEDISEIRQEMREFRREVHEEFRQVRADVASLRSDLTQVALAVRTHADPQTG